MRRRQVENLVSIKTALRRANETSEGFRTGRAQGVIDRSEAAHCRMCSRGSVICLVLARYSD